MELDLSGVGFAVLGMLAEEPMHPYQVFQLLEKRRVTRLVRVNAGAVYHSTERLERDGLISKVGTERDGRRPERTTFAITERGRAALASHARAFLAEDLPAFPMFVMGLAGAHNLERADVVDALRRRRDWRAGELDELRTAVDSLRERHLARQYYVEVEFQAHQVAAELNWIDGVLDELEGGTLDWQPPTITTSRGASDAADS